MATILDRALLENAKQKVKIMATNTGIYTQIYLFADCIPRQLTIFQQVRRKELTRSDETIVR